MSDVTPPKRPNVPRGEPAEFTSVRCCAWCGGEPLADTEYCPECDVARPDAEWLTIQYRRVDG